MSSREGEHWTVTLYERYPDLYLPILEARKEAGAVEAEGVSRILSAAGGKKGKVLDLACGIGRHSIPLAKMGYEVVGYDLSSLFIDRARSWARSQGLDGAKVRFYEGDVRRVADKLLENKEGGFDVVISLFSSLGAYGEAEDASLLRDLLRVCSPGCLLLIETLNRDFVMKRFQPYNIQVVSQNLRLIDLAKFNFEDSTLEDEWRFYTETPDSTLKPELVLKISGRVYTLQELKELVAGAGWSYVGSRGNLVAPGPVSADSPTFVLLAKKPLEGGP